MAQTGRSHKVLAWTAGGVALALVAASGWYAVASTAAGTSLGDRYRTTVVSTGTVSQQLGLTGAVQRVNQVSLSFPSSGSASAVKVAVGQHVSVGQLLATP